MTTPTAAAATTTTAMVGTDDSPLVDAPTTNQEEQDCWKVLLKDAVRAVVQEQIQLAAWNYAEELVSRERLSHKVLHDDHDTEPLFLDDHHAHMIVLGALTRRVEHLEKRDRERNITMTGRPSVSEERGVQQQESEEDALETAFPSTTHDADLTVVATTTTTPKSDWKHKWDQHGRAIESLTKEMGELASAVETLHEQQQQQPQVLPPPQVDDHPKLLEPPLATNHHHHKKELSSMLHPDKETSQVPDLTKVDDSEDSFSSSLPSSSRGGADGFVDASQDTTIVMMVDAPSSVLMAPESPPYREVLVGTPSMNAVSTAKSFSPMAPGHMTCYEATTTTPSTVASTVATKTPDPPEEGANRQQEPVAKMHMVMNEEFSQTVDVAEEQKDVRDLSKTFQELYQIKRVALKQGVDEEQEEEVLRGGFFPCTPVKKAAPRENGHDKENMTTGIREMSQLEKIFQEDYDSENEQRESGDLVVFGTSSIFCFSALRDNPGNMTLVKNLLRVSNELPRSKGTTVWIHAYQASEGPGKHLEEIIQSDGYAVTLGLGKVLPARFPADVKVVFLFWPDTQFKDFEINALKELIAQGGRVVYVATYGGRYHNDTFVHNGFFAKMGVSTRNMGGYLDPRWTDANRTSFLTPALPFTTNLKGLRMRGSSRFKLGPRDQAFLSSSETKSAVIGLVAHVPLSTWQHE